MKRRRLSAQEAKEMILLHAHKLFVQKGYDKATMDDLCVMANMSKGNIYHHFKNKKMIYLQLLKNYVDNYLIKVTPKSDVTSPPENLIMIAEQLGKDCKNPIFNSVGEFAKTLEDDLETLEEVNRLIEKTHNSVRDTVENGIKEGYFIKQDNLDLSLTVISMLAGVSQYCLSMPQLNEKDYIQFHINAIKLLMSGILVDKHD